MTNLSVGSPITDAKLSRVPKLTVDYWIVLLATLVLGETAADCLNVYFDLGLLKAAVIVSIALPPILALQFFQNRYVPFVFWTALSLVNIAGALSTDILVEAQGLGHKLIKGILNGSEQ